MPTNRFEELDRLVEVNLTLGADMFIRRLKEFIVLRARSLQAIFPLDDDRAFRQRATALLSWSDRRQSQALRLAQLREGSFPLWVYRIGNTLHPDPVHLSWDRLVLPHNHPFWETRFPANGWTDSAYVVGARTTAGAVRVGGDPSKPLPPDWGYVDAVTGLPLGVTPGFETAEHPGMRACLDALLQGHLHIT